VIIWMLRSHPGQKLFSFAMACILGGAIGNVIDRMVHGYVIDFWISTGPACTSRLSTWPTAPSRYWRHLPDSG
jgi:lipoprotein signal peptidase